MKTFGAPTFHSYTEFEKWANNTAEAGKTGLVWVIIAGVAVAVLFFTAGAVTAWVVKKGQSDKTIPSVPNDTLSEVREQFNQEGVLKNDPLERGVLEDLACFMQPEERIKFVKAAKTAEEKKYRFPRRKFDDPEKALEFLGSKDIGVEVGEKSFKAAWNRGLPAEKRKEDKKDKKDPVVEELQKMGEELKKMRGEQPKEEPTEEPAPAGAGN